MPIVPLQALQYWDAPSEATCPHWETCPCCGLSLVLPAGTALVAALHYRDGQMMLLRGRHESPPTEWNKAASSTP